MTFHISLHWRTNEHVSESYRFMTVYDRLKPFLELLVLSMPITVITGYSHY